MTKEQEIYRNMKKRGRIFRAHGKYGIGYAHLYCSIKEAGYPDDATIWQIIDGMERRGYIRQSVKPNGKTAGHCGNYVIEKWIN
jgi:hypothetical protein